MRQAIIILSIALLLQGCKGRNMYDLGWDDGHASGYNTTCEIRSTIIEGAWDNIAYSMGYSEGYATGAKECREGVKY